MSSHQDPSTIPENTVDQAGLYALSGQLGQLLIDRGESLAVAESCTGGRITSAITAHAGASRYFKEGLCVYSNEAKSRYCGVSAELLALHGAVSETVARQLARGIRERSLATWGLSSTGIAGPGGGSPEKPVGTVHIALSSPSGEEHLQLSLVGSREQIMTSTTHRVLTLLLSQLTGPTP